MKTILAAIDFSDATPRVVEVAISITRAFGASLRLFHVIEPEPGYVTYGFTTQEFPAMAEIYNEKERRANQRMNDWVSKARLELPGTSSSVELGSPLQSLLDQVGKCSADLVVVGTHGHGVVGSLLLGSVAEGMVRKATVPTLVVPAINP